MIFLNVNKENPLEVNELKTLLQNVNKKILVLVHLVGCGPCQRALPEWEKLRSNIRLSKYKDLVVVKLDQEIKTEFNHSLLNNVSSFPTIKYLNRSSDFDGNERTEDNFTQWIEKEIKRNNHNNNFKHVKKINTKKFGNID